MTEPKAVSIVLPTYNRAHCIERTIDSILGQTFTDWELIICDDGSTDNTQLIAERYCLRDTRVKYHRNPQNMGLPRNRNTGVSLSRGRLIYFIEDDVVLEPDCLEMLVTTCEELKAAGNKVGAVGPRNLEPKKQGRLLILERQVGNRVRGKMKSPSLIDRWTGLLYQNYGWDCGEVKETMLVPSWSLFDRAALMEVGGYEGKVYNRFNYSHEETDFFVRLRKAGYKLYFQPKAVAHHNHEARGGTRTSGVKYFYYYLGAHLVFLARNYGWGAAYMIPACLLFLTYGVVRSTPALLSGRG